MHRNLDLQWYLLIFFFVWRCHRNGNDRFTYQKVYELRSVLVGGHTIQVDNEIIIEYCVWLIERRAHIIIHIVEFRFDNDRSLIWLPMGDLLRNSRHLNSNEKKNYCTITTNETHYSANFVVMNWKNKSLSDYHLSLLKGSRKRRQSTHFFFFFF